MKYWNIFIDQVVLKTGDGNVSMTPYLWQGVMEKVLSNHVVRQRADGKRYSNHVVRKRSAEEVFSGHFSKKRGYEKILVDRQIGKKVMKKPPTETLTFKMATAVSAKTENI